MSSEDAELMGARRVGVPGSLLATVFAGTSTRGPAVREAAEAVGAADLLLATGFATASTASRSASPSSMGYERAGVPERFLLAGSARTSARAAALATGRTKGSGGEKEEEGRKEEVIGEEGMGRGAELGREGNAGSILARCRSPTLAAPARPTTPPRATNPPPTPCASPPS